MSAQTCGLVGGPIGCELAQAFQRVGSRVILLHMNAHLLDREDTEAAAIVQRAFFSRRDNTAPRREDYPRRPQCGEGIIWYESQGKETSAVVDEMLIGTDRTPKDSTWKL